MKEIKFFGILQAYISHEKIVQNYNFHTKNVIQPTYSTLTKCDTNVIVRYHTVESDQSLILRPV